MNSTTMMGQLLQLNLSNGLRGTKSDNCWQLAAALSFPCRAAKLGTQQA